MAFRVRLTPEVADDAEKLYWRIIEEAPLRGQEWYSGLIAAIDSLNSNPLRCPMAPDRALREFEVRYLLYGRRPNFYRILFRVLGEQKIVEVLHIRHGAMKQLGIAARRSAPIFSMSSSTR